MSLRRSSVAAVAVAVSLAFAMPAQASPWVLAPGEFYSELNGSFFSTDTYYRDEDKERVFLGGKFEQRMLSAHNELGWKKNAMVWLDLTLVERTFAPDGDSSASSTGLGDLGLGVRYRLRAGKNPMAMELGWTAPSGTNRHLFPGTTGAGGLDGTSLTAQMANYLSDSSTFFSQGLQSLSLSLHGGGAIMDKGFWTAGAGYTTRYFTFMARKDDDRFADFFTGSAEAGWWFSREFLATIEFHGEWQTQQGSAYDRIATDDTDVPDLQSTWLLLGPRFTYRVDEKMDVFAGSRHTPGGRNVLHHDLYYLGIAWKHTSLDRLAGALGGTKAR
jgi:hypothetical protein